MCRRHQVAFGQIHAQNRQRGSSARIHTPDRIPSRVGIAVRPVGHPGRVRARPPRQPRGVEAHPMQRQAGLLVPLHARVAVALPADLDARRLGAPGRRPVRVVLLIGNDEGVVVELEARRPEVVLELVAEPRGRGLRTWHRRVWVHSSPGPGLSRVTTPGRRRGPLRSLACSGPRQGHRGAVLGYRATAKLLGVSHTTVSGRVRQQALQGQPGRLGKVGTVWWPSASACRAWWTRG